VQIRHHAFDELCTVAPEARMSVRKKPRISHASPLEKAAGELAEKDLGDVRGGAIDANSASSKDKIESTPLDIVRK
jgi:hypothetical protein